jgi:hypothetical protein
MLKRPLAIAAIGMLAAASVATAQDHGMDHGMHGDHVMGATPVATEPGQSAFAAIQEVVDLLTSDPRTDWSSVDIEGLRQHLIDMDNVTMRATVTRRTADDDTTFIATSDDPGVTASIQRMVAAHAATMNGVNGWTLTAETVPDGAALTARGNPEKIAALGFIGIMATGDHHQVHHLALARGALPH